MKPYSMDLRERVLADCDAGMPTPAVAQTYRVSASWVRRLKPRRRGDGTTAPRDHRPGPPPSWAGYADRLRRAVADDPDATLAELRARLGLAVALPTLWRAVAALGLTVKKTAPAAEQDRPDVRQKRDAWRAAQPALDPTRLVFLDEAWASTAMTRRSGRSPRGERLVCPVPHGHWTTTTFVAALRVDGRAAPMVVDGAVTGDLFVASVEQVLVPARRPGDVAVMDNLRAHKRVGAVRAIERVGGSVAYRPPYSPDPNPIEHAFSKLKALLRAAERRTVDGRWAFLGQSLDLFTPAECQNYVRHCGYNATPTSKPL